MKYRKITGTHAESKLYGNIGTWFANGDIFTSFLEQLEAEGFKELTLRMHCYGGVVFEGNVMKNAMERSSLKINIIIDGVAASMGCMILPGVPRENVSIASNAYGMIHRPAGGGDGDADDHLAAAKLLQDMEAEFIKVISGRASLSEDEVRSKFFDGKEHWLNADEMVQYGFAIKKISAVAATIKILDKEVVEGLPIETIYDRYAAVLNKNSKPKNFKTMDKALLIAAFALQGVTAESDDAAVLAALQLVFKNQGDRITQLENDAKAKTEAQIKAMLDEADQAGKIMATTGQTKEQARAALEAVGNQSMDTLRTVLAAMPGKKSITSQIRGGSGGGSIVTGGAAGAKTWAWYQENDSKALERMEKEDNDNFRELFKNEYGVYPE